MRSFTVCSANDWIDLMTLRKLLHFLLLFSCLDYCDLIVTLTLGHFLFTIVSMVQGIGDSSQGWVNAILYIFASKLIRKKLFWEPFLKLLRKSRSFMTVSAKTKHDGNTSQPGAEREPPMTNYSEVSHPLNLSINVNYPSETYFSIPYTDIGLRSDTIDPIQRF